MDAGASLRYVPGARTLVYVTDIPTGFCMARLSPTSISLVALVLLSVDGLAQSVAAQPPSPSDPAMARQRAADSALRNDYANFARYRDANVQLGAPARGTKRVVFMGNSITEGWVKYFPTMFSGKPYVGRGIGGQTTPQMLVRFHADVVALNPSVVVILGGTNDIAGNTGPSSVEMIEHNLQAMTEIAQANRIRVVLSSVLPVYDYPWKRGLDPAAKIVVLNAWMKAYAARVGAVYLDYHTAMRDERDGLRAALGDDGVHPNEAGYRIMSTLAEAAIAEALRRSK